jgi:DNA-binding NarL/FixJ family response regulator
VVVLSGYLDSQAMSEACHSGADGFLCKPVEPDKLVKALEFCLNGGIPVDTELREQMRCLMDGDPVNQPDDPRLDDKHNALMRALAKAESYTEISEELGMTLPQVKKKLNRIYKYYQVNNRTDAVEMWRRGRKARR